MATIINILVSTGAVLLGSYILPGVQVTGFGAAFITAILLAIVNAVIRPVLLLFTLPINVLTLGLFTLVIDALIIMAVAALVPGFRVRGFLWAFIFAAALAIINSGLHAIIF